MLGEDHPYTLITHYHLAWALGKLCHWEEAKVAYREVLEARRRVLGEDHPSSLRTQKALKELDDRGH